ncbi:MAG TPA: hypothetical protein VMI74_16565 [Burkholderiales bacterium]|nr:hypothetical protein [Burkholderiales bacterium]
MNDSNGHRDHRVSSIYREGAWPEPGRQIDQAILAASRRAVRERHPRLMRWAPPVAIAATVLLTSSLVLKVFLAQPEAVSPSAPEPELRARQAPAEEEKPVEARPPRTEAPAQQPDATPPGFSSTMDAGEAARLDRMKRDLGAMKLSTIPSESPVPEPRPGPALKKEAARPAAAANTPQAAAPLSVFGATTPARSAAAAKPAQPLVQAPATAPAQPQAQEAQPAPAPPPVVQAAAISSAAAKERTPQAWIEDIRALMKEGKFEETGAEIAKFKKRYPDYVLPEDLR